MKNHKILIIGGAGYIGSHLVYELNDNNFQTIVLDDLSTGFIDNVDKRSEFIEGSFFDKELLDKILKDIDVVIHMAALKDVGKSGIMFNEYLQHNIINSLELIRLCIKNNIKKFVFSSSAAVYGIPNYLPIDEKHQLSPINFYGYTKLCIENNLEWAAKFSDMKVGCLRYFNAAGYDMNKRIIKKEKNPNNLLPIVMEVASNKRPHLDIYGDDYDTPDGTCLRDYIHVNDLSDGHVKALNFLDSHDSIFVNLSTGIKTSVLEVINCAEKITNQNIKFKVIGRRGGDPPALYSKSILASSSLSWKPEYSNIDIIIKTMWEMYK